ncbi:MAG: hypothetical protein LBS43_03330 [Prevotellaceae bacterium]|jgi:hypothetical protein|nr:hypothetical protein [Prevotellaceae bacterium]
MRIKYYLLDNPVTPDPNDCRAQVSGYEVITEKELFEHMTRSGSGVTLAEAKGSNTIKIEGSSTTGFHAGLFDNYSFTNRIGLRAIKQLVK